MKNILKIIQDITKKRVIVHITDTYFLNESKNGKEIEIPGFARIYRILEILSKNKENEILFVHSGDFLFPSFLSNFFKGKQMISILNECKLDYCTLGNHDFDGGLKILKSRIKESKFNYIITNLTAPKEITRNILQYDVWPKKSPKIALIGIVGKMTANKAVENGFKMKNAQQSLKIIDEIKEKFPEIKLLLVLSHMGDVEDIELKKTIQKKWPLKSIILGGHDHNQLISYNSKLDRCMLVKGQSNARTIQIIFSDKENTNEPKGFLQNKLLVLNSKHYQKISPSKKIRKEIDSWYKKLKNENKLPSNNVVKIFPKDTVLDATEVSLRKGTTNFGNFISDCLKNHTKSDIAFVNSGHFRGDRNFFEKLTERNLFDTFVMKQRGNILVTKLSTKECVLFLKHAYSQIGKGKILQFSKNALEFIKESKKNRKINVALISDMIFSNEDGFAEILAKNRKITVSKLQKLLRKDIIKNENLIDIILTSASKTNYDPEIRFQVGENSSHYQ
ncbi:metallophosphoesterase [Nitrosopumilus adriaticus]|uniref:Putative 5'-nucleotidase n=1 Tax=Nitrosopumilus adriaticus TaxID=1580092 RepID=A0A0D5C1K6_9ARCH|nr:metallophosphoesterase [Nitrosopumilus adriaticus]AJW70215.1 putative 5'-nucleotidase [Nitrosopumilus adriaticus]